MKFNKNKYWNTVWNDRDQEFYWSGVKHGALIATIMTSCLIAIGSELIETIKEHRKESE